ncbi:hypothetical protein MAR_003563 [Mya arenaria]|uniref:C-type lectin domain-containing protein n=1 Tax=Mya arenaria TaxID=6604 RepID=A0ABY7G6E7_MYAAR|nr:hypothetical protein MAR_003563 [Mya arenaria]
MDLEINTENRTKNSLRGVKEDGFPDIDHFGIQTGLPKRNTLPEDIADDTKSNTTTFKWPITTRPVSKALRPSSFPRGQPVAKTDGSTRRNTLLKLPDVSADAQPKVPCPSDWMQHGDRCYLFIQRPVHFTNIAEYCSEEGGSPAVLEDDKGTFEQLLVSGARPILECCLNEKGKRDGRPELLQRLDDDLIKFMAKFSTKWPQEEDNPKPGPNNRIIPRHLLLRKGVTTTSPTIPDIAATGTSSSFIQTKTDSMQTNADNGGQLDGGFGLINHEKANSTTTTTTTLSTSIIFADITTSSNDSELEVPVSGDKNTDQFSTLDDVTRNRLAKNENKNAKELPIFTAIQEKMCKSYLGAYMDEWLSVDCNVVYLQVCVKGQQ